MRDARPGPGGANRNRSDFALRFLFRLRRQRWIVDYMYCRGSPHCNWLYSYRLVLVALATLAITNRSQSGGEGRSGPGRPAEVR